MTTISYVIMIMKILTVAGSRRGTGVAVVSSIVRPPIYTHWAESNRKKVIDKK